MKTFKQILFFLFISLSLISCSKPENGKDGINGIDGKNGTNGTQGLTGSANVISSNWITASAIVRDSTIDGTCVRVRHFTAPELTTDILNKGQMITYMRVGSIGPYQLPYFSDAGGATNQVNCIYNLNKIIVYRHTINTCRFTSAVTPAFAGQPVMANLPSSLEYRYILIPPAAVKARNAVDLKSMLYQEACKYLNIKE